VGTVTERDHTALPAEEQARRRDALNNALAQVRLEGMEPDATFFDYAERYVRGETTLDAAVADFVRRVTRATATR
jgi:hypothetical protein